MNKEKFDEASKRRLISYILQDRERTIIFLLTIIAQKLDKITNALK